MKDKTQLQEEITAAKRGIADAKRMFRYTTSARKSAARDMLRAAKVIARFERDIERLRKRLQGTKA